MQKNQQIKFSELYAEIQQAFADRTKSFFSIVHEKGSGEEAISDVIKKELNVDIDIDDQHLIAISSGNGDVTEENIKILLKKYHVDVRDGDILSNKDFAKEPQEEDLSSDDSEKASLSDEDFAKKREEQAQYDEMFKDEGSAKLSFNLLVSIFNDCLNPHNPSVSNAQDALAENFVQKIESKINEVANLKDQEKKFNLNEEEKVAFQKFFKNTYKFYKCKESNDNFASINEDLTWKESFKEVFRILLKYTSFKYIDIETSGKQKKTFAEFSKDRIKDKEVTISVS